MSSNGPDGAVVSGPVESDGFRTVRCADLVHLTEALTQAAEDLVTRVLPEQNRADPDWNTLRVELWPDSGRVIVFPARNPYTDRIDVGGAQVVCAEIQTLFDRSVELEEDGEQPLSDLTGRVLAAIEKVMQRIAVESYELYLYGDEHVYPA